MVDSKGAESVITLALSGDTMTSGDLREIVTAFDGPLKAVTGSVCHDAADVPWAVRPKAGGVLLGCAPMGDVDVEQIKEAFAQALDGRAVAKEYG